MTEFENISKWTRPPHYMGATWPKYYSSGVGQSRDSSALERANFAAMLAALEAVENPDGIPGTDERTVQVVRESHWAVGWVEWIAIHESDVKALECADRIMGELADYPVIDEDLFSQFEDEECEQVWANCYDEKERAQYLREHVHKAFGAFGESVYSTLRAAVKGSWSHAANLLPCPSDLLS